MRISNRLARVLSCLEEQLHETFLPFAGHTELVLVSCVLTFSHRVDRPVELMARARGQALRAAGCQEECALCADSSSPCQNCFLGNPSAAICDDPDTRIFWDDIHFTTGIHRHFAAAVVECSRDFPDPARPFVEQLCPHTSSV